jgi:hypothetical protein
MLSLPHGFHHVLCTRLCDYARLHGALNIRGDVDLLLKVAEIVGLHELVELRKALRLAGASVRLTSPPPMLHLFFANGVASAGRIHTPRRSRKTEAGETALSAGNHSR